MSFLKKFPSYDYLIKGAVAVCARFPFTMISAVFGSAVAVSLIGDKFPDEAFMHHRLLMVAALGLPLFTTLAVYAEKRQWKKGTAYTFQAVGVVVLAVYYLLLPEDVVHPQSTIVRFWLLNIGLHFLAAFMPFLGKDQIAGFWQYNKSLALRFLLAALYSGVLYIGLAIALAAADHLFGMDIKDERYFQLWVMIAGVFNSWVFLAGVPDNLEKLNQSNTYPKGLKLFTQYILLPLVGLYFVILITYEAKIIVTWNWPKGWVSQLVLWYSVVGLLSMLLLHPLREKIENRWINVFSKWFFRALVPLVVMLFLAIMRRINEYGITENRYFVLAMAIGLAVIMIYFLFSKIRDIRIIPIVLFCIAILSSFGPWGAFSLSLRNQQARLETIMRESDMIKDGVLQKEVEKPDLETLKEMSSIISYVVDWHGPELFSRWFADSVLEQIDTLHAVDQKTEIAGLMGFEYISRSRSPGGYEGIWFILNKKQAVDISDYDCMIEFSVDSCGDSGDTYLIDGDTCMICFEASPPVFVVQYTNVTDLVGYSARLELVDELSMLVHSCTENRNTLPAERLTFEIEMDSIEASVIFRSIFLKTSADSLSVSQMNGYLLIRQRQ